MKLIYSVTALISPFVDCLTKINRKQTVETDLIHSKLFMKINPSSLSELRLKPGG